MTPIDMIKQILADVKDHKDEDAPKIEDKEAALVDFLSSKTDISVDEFKEFASKNDFDMTLGYAIKILNSLFAGGTSKNKMPDADQKEIDRGIEVESEHSPDKYVQLKIVADHLTEDPNYYTNLAKVEKD